MTCSRFGNISKLADAYLVHPEPNPFALRWHIMVQSQNDPDRMGVRKTNEAIDFIRNGWLFCFADDTVQHPALFRRLGEVIAENPNAGCVMFAGYRTPDEIFHPSEEKSRTGFICGGMIAYERGFLGDLRYDLDEPLHRTDGRLVARLYAKDPSRFVHIDEALTKENSMEWPT